MNSLIQEARLTSIRITPALPMVYQDNPMECGLACVAMIAGHYGHPISLQNLRTAFDVGRNGLSMNSILRVFENLGHSATALDAPLSDLQELTEPRIIHTFPGHYVVLRRLTPTRAYIHDPACGPVRISVTELGRIYTGSAIVMFPGEGRVPIAPNVIMWRF